MREGTLYEDKRGNIVFVGFDEHHTPRFASLRGTYGDSEFRQDCAGSGKRYGFHMTYSQSERLYIFESAIDAMSHASLWNCIDGDQYSFQWDNRLSLSGTSDAALRGYLESHPNVKELVFCLDNDPPGREAAAALARKYAARGYITNVEVPEGKDFNDDLRAMMSRATFKVHKEISL